MRLIPTKGIGTTGLLSVLGTACAACSLLGYEILTARILGVVIGGHAAILALAFAMMGMGIATSLLSVDDKPDSHWDGRSLGFLGAILGLSYFGVLVTLTWIAQGANAEVERAIAAGGLPALIAVMRSQTLALLVAVGCVQAVPYFIFGIFIAVLFRSVGASRYHAVYAADLVGAAGGCILAIVLLERFSYLGGVVLILASALIASLCFSGVRPTRAGAVASLVLAGAVVILVGGGTLSRVEPRPSLALLGRDYDHANEIKETWHVWNGQSRVGLLDIVNRSTGQTRSVYSHENGDGWAVVGSGTSNERLVTMFNPKRVLVMFAGVGADMFAIDEYCGGTCGITGVEINRQMVDHALTNIPRLRKFFSRPGISFQVAEGREFLERDQSRYDAILLSWWGAGTSYYVGTVGRLAQYMYTKEAFQALFDHLTPSGIIVVYNGSKAEMLTTLRSVYADLKKRSLRDDVVVVQGKSDSDHFNTPGFFDALEEMRLVVKPSGFSSTDLSIIRSVTERIGSVTVLSPDSVDPRYAIYREVQDSPDIEKLNEALASTRNVALMPVTDDRPFLNDLTPPSFYFDPPKWSGPTPNPAWAMTRGLAGGVLVLLAVALVLTVGPLLLKSGPALNGRNVMRLAYFWILGSGFMLIETGYVSKLGLVLGHPSYAIAIVLAALIFSTGMGALSSRRIMGQSMLSEKSVAALIAVCAIGGTFAYQAGWRAVIVLSTPVKAALVIAFLFPLGFLMGQLLPHALAKAATDDIRLVPWLWAVNSVAATTAVGVAFIFSTPLGFNALIYVGAVLYGTILLLPVGARRALQEPAAAAV